MRAPGGQEGRAGQAAPSGPSPSTPSDSGDANGRNGTGDIVNVWGDWVNFSLVKVALIQRSFCSWDLKLFLVLDALTLLI